MRGKHEVDFRDSLTGEGPYSLLALAIKFSWLNIARQLIIHGYNPNRLIKSYQSNQIYFIANSNLHIYTGG